MTKLALFLPLLALTGCATCRDYPVVCAAGVAIAITSIALSIDHRNPGEDGRIGPPLEPNCQKLPEMCK